MGFMLKNEEYEQIKDDLEEFLHNSEARTALLCDRGGNIIVSSGDSITESMDMISALVAGAFAATKELRHVIRGKRIFLNFSPGYENKHFYFVGGRRGAVISVIF